MVELLELLGYRAESGQKVVSLNPGLAIRLLGGSPCQPSSKLIPILNQGNIRQRAKGETLSSKCAQDNVGFQPPLPLHP